MRRNALGIIALLLLCVGTYFSVWPPEGGSQKFAHGSVIKAGAVLAAIWLAYPQLEKLPGWIFGTILAASLVIAIRPKLALIILPLLPLLWILKPRSRGNAKRPPASSSPKEKSKSGTG